MLSRIPAAALILLAPVAAQAQFAGVVAAPPRRAEALFATPAELASQRDSVRTEALSDMRAWVDSAAGIVTVTPETPAAPDRRTPTPASDTTRRAPATPARPPRR